VSPAERLSRADRAQAAMDEFVGPAFDYVENEWMEKLVKTAGTSDPRLPEIISRLSAGVAAIRKVRAEIEAVVADGKIAEGEIARSAQLGRMSDFKRSVVGV